jgi:hypothetical protein
MSAGFCVPQTTMPDCSVPCCACGAPACIVELCDRPGHEHSVDLDGGWACGEECAERVAERQGASGEPVRQRTQPDVAARPRRDPSTENAALWDGVALRNREIARMALDIERIRAAVGDGSPRAVAAAFRLRAEDGPVTMMPDRANWIAGILEALP